MAGRLAYFLIAGGALIGGMATQGDIRVATDFVQDGWGVDRRVEQRVDRSIDRTIDRTVDRIIDAKTDEMVQVRDDDGEAIDASPQTKRALASAVAELLRAEGSLAMTDVEDEGAAALAAAERRRDAARATVDRLAEQAKRESRASRDEVRQTIRDEVRS